MLKHLNKTALLAGLLSAATLLTPTLASAEWTPSWGDGLPNDMGEVNQRYEISLGGRLLTNHGESHAAGTDIDLWQRTLAGSTVQQNQQWEWEAPADYAPWAARLETGSFGLLRNVESGLCLAPAVKAADARVTQTWCDPRSYRMMWRGARDSSGAWTLQNVLTNEVLGIDAERCDGRDGTLVRTRTTAAGGSACAAWQIKRVPVPGGVPIRIDHVVFDKGPTGRSLTGSGKWGALPVVEPTRPGAQEQTWYFQFAGILEQRRVFRIVNVPGGDWSKATCLDVDGNRPRAGGTVATYGCEAFELGQDNQLWFGERVGSRTDVSVVRLRNVRAARTAAQPFDGAADSALSLSASALTTTLGGGTGQDWWATQAWVVAPVS